MFGCLGGDVPSKNEERERERERDWGRTYSYGPALDFIRAGSEEVDQAKRVVAGPDDLGYGAGGLSLRQIVLLFFWREFQQLCGQILKRMEKWSVHELKHTYAIIIDHLCMH